MTPTAVADELVDLRKRVRQQARLIRELKIEQELAEMKLKAHVELVDAYRKRVRQLQQPETPT